MLQWSIAKSAFVRRDGQWRCVFDAPVTNRLLGAAVAQKQLVLRRAMADHGCPPSPVRDETLDSHRGFMGGPPASPGIRKRQVRLSSLTYPTGLSEGVSQVCPERPAYELLPKPIRNIAMKSITPRAVTRGWWATMSFLCQTLLATLAVAVESGPASGQPTMLIKSESFDKDPGWEGHNNRVIPEHVPTVIQDFGYSKTNFGGKAAGELGGQVTRAAEPA